MVEESTGEQILKGLSETRRFFEQVSLLVRTGEEYLREQGWEAVVNSNQSSDVTSHLSKPRQWMPKWVSRVLTNEEHKDLLVYLGVLLDEAGTWAGFREPWVTCGLVQYVPGRSPSEYWALAWVTSHLDCERDPDGEVCWDEYEPGEPDSERLLREMSMALPLVQVTGAEDLRNLIVAPLLAAVEEASTRSEEAS